MDILVIIQLCCFNAGSGIKLMNCAYQLYELCLVPVDLRSRRHVLPDYAQQRVDRPASCQTCPLTW